MEFLFHQIQRVGQLLAAERLRLAPNLFKKSWKTSVHSSLTCAKYHVAQHENQLTVSGSPQSELKTLSFQLPLAKEST